MAETDSKWDLQWEGWEQPAWPAYTVLRINWFLRICEQLVRSGQLGSVPTILEVGAGSGWVTRPLSGMFPESPYLCADVSSEALNKLRAMKLPNVTTCLMGDLEQLGAVADMVICGDVYEHVEDRPLFFRQIRSVLKPGGHLLLSTPNRFMPVLYFRRMLGKEATGQPYDRPVDLQQLQRTLVAEGFDIVDCHLENAETRPDYSDMPPPKRAVFKGVIALVAAGLWMARRPMADTIMVHARYTGRERPESGSVQ